MNRIILIGNGFDLAHCLPTGYENFIDWYWEERLMGFSMHNSRISEDILCTFEIAPTVKHGTWGDVFDHWRFKYPGTQGIKFMKDAVIGDSKGQFKITYSDFFGRICKSIKTKKWVDIEDEYYQLLIKYAVENKKNGYKVKKLNAQLHYIQELLVRYFLSLKPVSENKLIKGFIYEPIKAKDIAVAAQEKLVNHFQYWIQQSEDTWRDKLQQYEFSDDAIQEAIDWRTDLIGYGETKVYEEPEIETLARYNIYRPNTGLFPNKILFLNFNYTENAYQYFIKNTNCIKFNYIHGRLDKPDSIIFGYGDELDGKYNKLLGLNDKECLRHVKSYRYLESSNYRDMLSFIESAPYQVYIMGHSCGVSDRTLLNTLFEHRNCVTIKPFYHKKEDKTDDYLDIVQNISRSFTDMKLMRDRVVNKTFCEPLPQTE